MQIYNVDENNTTACQTIQMRQNESGTSEEVVRDVFAVTLRSIERRLTSSGQLVIDLFDHCPLQKQPEVVGDYCRCRDTISWYSFENKKKCPLWNDMGDEAEEPSNTIN